jgi:hypothetical protein
MQGHSLAEQIEKLRCPVFPLRELPRNLLAEFWGDDYDKE